MLTVTVVPLAESTVNVPSLFAVTVPTTAGLVPVNGGRELEEPELGGAHAPDGAVEEDEADEVEAPATLPPATTNPNATAAALMTRTPLRRLPLISGYGSKSVSMVPSPDWISLMLCSLLADVAVEEQH
jgi:hypothetical protein